MARTSSSRLRGSKRSDRGRHYRPDALRSALKVAADHAVRIGKTVALPDHLSCGICGGNWDEVLGIIYETMKDVEYVGIVKKLN